ncbi:family 20 glycosylhydrolase [Paraflavitalea sp. CAU 1676]|uniref:family 20 glycosylhydrolase n=1 Tax=Paraflavitalea sp. CAU 1676 TaxID=3032598 RepID=UPI0023DC0E2B|nr:family 20 glycosylhydrolase [Paraflavitalea sp. CAU 1676]MDF2188743.1 family 20 glycosylhydrolase [Paraflavitalea sp. CAU 1676]
MKLHAVLLCLCFTSAAIAQKSGRTTVTQPPALIPLPQEVTWKTGKAFELAGCKIISIADSSLLPQAIALQQFIHQAGGKPVIRLKARQTSPSTIFLQLHGSATNAEAYLLSVSNPQISLTASAAHGLFNALQTLYQLAGSGNRIPPCTIRDWPAFTWRGYMIDVGRNYVSLPLLKEQIDVMARYKLNIFHFHATEDIAWRIASKRYPQLTAPENMIRDKGSYYSEADLKELIGYCRERFITLVPEIDMPGHSAAFTRALHTTMQSDTGLRIVKNLLEEFCDTYDLPYVHIGADEVKITNRDFIPAVTALLESRGRQVIGWQPGGNFNERTIRQLWMEEASHTVAGTATQFIDSRHLYLNHMDPLEAVTTIFNRQIGNKTRGDGSMLGATLCLWHDRKVNTETDLLQMNPVYPGMLAFAERTWRGGGTPGWVANLSDGDHPAFAAFEGRLLRHKALYFAGKIFPYAKQTGQLWSLYGPYNNNGNLTQSFEPETAAWSPETAKPAKTVTGGTVVLRHWWAPLIKGAIDHPVENSTWYATTSVWSDRDTIAPYWISFNNLSRSPATDSPPVDAWDTKGSRVWVNGLLVPPPTWQQAAQKGHSEIPLTDEGYEYRPAILIPLKKGLNTVCIKAPIGSFKGKDWQNPVKWMFTFCQAAGN